MQQQVSDQPAIDLTDRSFYRDPHAGYAWLRRNSPVHRTDAGFWAVSRYADIRFVSKTPDLFSTESGLTLSDLDVDAALGAEHAAELRKSGMDDAALRRLVNEKRMPPGATNLLGSDPPVHTSMRRLVSRAFTPKVVADLVPRIEEVVEEAFDEAGAGQTVDFVEAVSVPVSMYVIAELLGVPKERRQDFRRWTDARIEAADASDEERAAFLRAQQAEMWQFFAEQIERRRVEPGEDLTSLLIAAEVDGERLTEANVMMFLHTLLLAGNETTRNLISGAVVALEKYPDQRTLLIDRPDLLPSAVEELLRWLSPVISFGRTATQDTSLGGQLIEAGDFVLMLYAAGNRDETVWDRADELDVTRPVDPQHVAFGFGPHVCLGAHLARLEARITLGRLLQRFPGYRMAGEPTHLESTFINGIVELPVVLG